MTHSQTMSVGMVEITQDDRDAAGEVFEALLVATETILMTPDECEQIILQAFARHRKHGYDQGYYDGRQLDGKEERAAIVAWLRTASNGSETTKYANVFADEIEAGEHLK